MNQSNQSFELPLKYNNFVVGVFKVLAAPFNWTSVQFEKLSINHTQNMVNKWLKNIK